MERIDCLISGYLINFELAKAIAGIMATQENEFATLMAWCDRDKGKHSPHCLQCEIKGEPAWEVYGRNHNGRLRISIDTDRFVFIFS